MGERRLRCSAHRRTLSRPFARGAALYRRSSRARSRLRAAGPRGRRRLRALRFRARAPGAARADGVHSGGVGRKCVPDRRRSAPLRSLGAAIRAARTKRASHLLVSPHAGAPARAGSLGLPTKLQEAFATIRSLDEEDAGAARRLGARQRASRREKAKAAPLQTTRQALSPRSRSVASRHRGCAGGARRLRRRACFAAAADGGTAQSALRRCRGRGGGYRRRRRAHLRARHHQGALS